MFGPLFVHRSPSFIPVLWQQAFVRRQRFGLRCFASNTANMDALDSANIEEIRREFGQTRFGGGSFKLCKDLQTGVATLAISNPAKKNCFSGSMMAQFTTILDELQHWKEGKAVVIYGEGGFFSSGGDLDTVRQIVTKDGGTKMIQLMQHNLHRLQQLPLLTLAYVEGMSFGGGAELMTACDFRLAATDASIGFVQVRIGITTVWGGGARLVRLVGYSKALDLISTGRTISATEAKQIGLVDHLVDRSSLQQNKVDEPSVVLATVEEFLKPFVRHSPQCLQVAKKVASNGLSETPDLKLDGTMAKEMSAGLELWGGVAHRTALQGKVNHRKK